MLKTTTSNKINNITQQYALSQMIKDPTHFTENSSSIIDLFLVKQPACVTFCGVAEPFLENDLICFFGGGNDYIGHSESASYISQNYLQCIQALYDNGARNLVLLNMLDLYSMPSVVDPSATQVSIDVNESISSIPSLFADANIYIYDFYSKLNDILADPVSYGISDSPFYDDTHLNQQVHSEIANQIYTTFIAQVQPDILALGKDSFDLYDKAINPHPPIQFPDQSSIKVKVSDFEIDAISDFSFSRTLNLSPIYAIHQGDSQDWENGKSSLPNLEPVQIDTQYPIETDINFTMIAQSYQIREIKDRIQSAPKSDVSIEIRDSKTNEMISHLVGENVRLISESITSSVAEEMSISLTYKGYEASHNPVS